MSSELSLEQLFDKIHRQQAEAMLKILQTGEDIPPSAFSAINKFLSDNQITGLRDSNKTLDALANGLEAYEQGDNVAQFQKRKT